MQRRNFIQISSAGIISFLFGKFNLPAFAQAAQAQNNKKILVMIELKGGNDGLNTVIPFSDDNYYKLRPGIGINRDSVLKLSDSLGLNPAMTSMMKIWQQKDLAIILGVGYPEPNRSHFRSIEIWETASNSQETLQDGWIARSFEKISKVKKQIDGIIIGQGDEGPLSGVKMNNLVMTDPQQFIKDAKKFKAMIAQTDNDALEHVLKVESEIYKSADIIEKQLKLKKENLAKFPETNIGKQFRSASEIILDDIPVSVIKLEHGSFDTHTNQRAKQDKLLKDFSDALLAFKESMVKANMWNNVLVITYSEFGRRAAQNGSGGTDHGTAAPHFITGGKVKGGFYGKQPELDDLVQGDLKFKVDYRNIYSSIAKNWWGSSVDFLVKYPPIDFL